MAIGAYQREMLAGPMIAALVLGLQAVFEALLPLPTAYQFLGQTREAARRLLDIIEAEPELRFPVRSSLPQDACICFDKIFFSHGGQPVLAGIDLTLRAGSQTTLIGPSGAGKSTIAHLLARFWDPHKGRILIGGVPLGALSETELRRRIAVLPQRPHLFNATLRDNLLLARPAASD